MKTKFLFTLTAVLLFLIPGSSFGQTVNLGTAADFVLFSSNGAVTNTGITNLTGNVGTNSGSITGFGNVNGVMHSNDGASAQSAADLLIAYNQLNSTVPTFSHAPLLGNGDTLVAGVYDISGATTLNLGLTLDAKGNANAVFIFKVGGTFSTNVAAKIHLINAAKACNVYWKVEGLVSLASETKMSGTIIANNAAIVLTTNDTIEGRILSTAGAITTNGVLAYTPVVPGVPLLTGPKAPGLGSTKCYALFSGNGPVTNTGVSSVMGDIGTNVGLTSGYNALLVTGSIHPIADGSTALCAADLLVVYDSLNTLPADIELLYPAQFGNNLVLTPHTYLMNAATVLTDTLYLNALGNADAVFVLKINGALSTGTHSKISLINGAQSKNVFWKVDGPAEINDYSVFEGTIVANNGAVSLKTGVILDGRAYTTTGAFSTAGITTIMPSNCTVTAAVTIDAENTNDAVTISPNPFNSYINITLTESTKINVCNLIMYNVMGKEVINTTITNQITRFKTSDLHPGIYFYKVVNNNKVIQTGKLISQ
jgi:hypothetical protein